MNGEERKSASESFTLEDVAGTSAKRVVANIVYFDLTGERKYAQIDAWIYPVIFDILWEADSVVTPLYRGHKLAGPGVPIRISANIQYTDRSETIYTPEDFSFRWEIESRLHSDQGPGVSSIVYEEGADFYNNRILVKVNASLIYNSSISFSKTITIPVSEPQLLLYPYTLLYGLSTNHTFSQDLFSDTQKVTSFAYPFYFSKSGFDSGAIQYKWFVDGGLYPRKEGRRIDVSAVRRWLGAVTSDC